jgi:FAD/FMN-containing dehydrogenase/Fe-S oxidoreductase
VDEQQRGHILDDLKGIIRGELLFDDLSRVLYSTDGSIFQVQPAGIVVPLDEEDLQGLVRYAAENRIPLVARGAGSGLAGEALGSGLIVDFSRHFRSILEIGADTVRVQPGVVYEELRAQLARVNRRFAPDPDSRRECTVGGILARNASGARLLRHGYTRDHVESLRIVLDSGDVAVAGRHRRTWLRHPEEARLGEVVVATVDLLTQHAGLLHDCRQRTAFNRCGYALHDVLGPDFIDLHRILIGSEGTLAFVTEATLKTIPLPAGRGAILLGCTSLESALRTAQQLLPSGPSACELIDHRLLTLARGRDARVAALVPSGAEAALLVEFEADTPQSARTLVRDAYNQLYKTERFASYAVMAFEPTEMDRIWQLRELAMPGLLGLRGGARPVPIIDDAAVPIEELATYLRRTQEILQRHETTASYLVHVGTGQVNTRPFLDLDRSEDAAKLPAIADEVHSLALDLGGTVSAQHGTGLARTPWVARQYGPLYPVLRDLKTIFDPHEILNPGKIIAKDSALKPDWTLRRPLAHVLALAAKADALASNGASAPETAPELAPVLRWHSNEVRQEVSDCNGCGRCRTEVSSQRMCPIFRATQAEAATPRAKANLMRYLLQEGTDSRLLSSDQVREVADLCVNCKMCAIECPAHVNIPKLMLEAKAANAAEHGLSRSDWVLARTESLAAFGSAFAVFVNGAFSSRTVRWLMEKFFGVSRRRRLPRFASRSFLSRAARRGWTKPPRSRKPRVAYFVDVFANYNDPQIAEAAVAVLHHQGVEVLVPPDQVGSGMAPLAQGDAESARETAQKNLRVFSDLARQGYEILCSEPTAALMLSHDYPDLVDDLDVALVAEQTTELTSYLWRLHEQGRLRTDFRRLDFTVGHHVPCHLKALGGRPQGPPLLSLIPGLRVHTIDVNCSGMAGTFGLKAENYELSLKAGQPMLTELMRPGVTYGSTECSTCRLQMEDASGKRTLHPVQYLALAYGLMPEIGRRLQEPIGELVL